MENQKNLERNENGNKTCQNFWDVAKAILKGKFIVINAYIKIKEIPHISNPTLHLKERKKNKLSPKLGEGRK